MAFKEMPPGQAIPAATNGVQLGGVNSVHNSHFHDFGQDAALEKQLRREVRNHLARCHQRRWAEALPHVSEMPSATGRPCRIQAWRADNDRDRVFEKRARA